MTTPDQQLLIQAQKLEPDALKALHERFYETVARYIQFKVGNPRTVEDLCGDVFVRILEGLQQGRGWRESPQGWIMGIARNVVADFYRRRERMTEVALNPNLTSSRQTDPTYHALQNETHRQLKAAIDQLTEEQRDVILMRFMEGVDIKSVANAINKSPGAVKGLQYRAMKALAEIMENEPEPRQARG